jgi:hypothetical protein
METSIKDLKFSTLRTVKEHQKISISYSGNTKQNKLGILWKYPSSVSSEVNSSEYGFSEDMTHLSFTTKKSNAMLVILSVCHCTGDDPQTGRQIINFYNLAKYGVYSLRVSRCTRKWLVAILCNA